MYEILGLYYRILENAAYYGLLALVFLTVVAMALAVSLGLRNRRNRAEQRLNKLIGHQEADRTILEKPKFLGGEQKGLAARLSRPLHKLSSLDERSARQKMRLKLIRAGYRSDQAIYNYLAMKILLPVAYVSFYLLTLFVYKLEAEAVLSLLFLLVFGFFTPNLWVFLMTKARQERIFKGLPDTLDLMVVCVESGLGLDMTFKRVGEEIRPICKDISDEFTLTNLEIRAGKQRDEAFRNMTLRTGTSEINNLMTVLNQTNRFGTSLAKALRVHADAMRIKRRQIAEETAAKAAVKLVFPLVLFIFPSIFVVLVGPGAIKIVKYLLPALGGG